VVAAELEMVLIDAHDPPPYRPSADLLLTTLALAAGSRTIAVVLSGTGHDGATGAAVVHRMGGTVIASDEASSAFFSMPRAAISKPGVVDATVALDQIGPLLVSW
jgi:two-component system chemotaxis response regulator CheB